MPLAKLLGGQVLRNLGMWGNNRFSAIRNTEALSFSTLLLVEIDYRLSVRRHPKKSGES
jgi:hypothetical protein